MLGRILVGIVGIPLLLFLLLSNNFYNTPLLFLLSVISILGVYELLYLYERKNIFLNKILVYPIVFISLLSFYFKDFLNISYLPGIWFIFSVFIYGLYLIFADRLENAVNEFGALVFAVFYLGILPGHIMLLKNLQYGNYFLLLIVLLIWFNDTAAYFGGTYLGRKKLLPFKASPNKSYMGLYFALFFSVVSVYFTNWILKLNIFNNGLLVFTGILFGLIVVFSDLIESVIKRSAGVKDSKSLLPGHGGVLDIFDSWFFTIPLFYYYVKLLYLFKLL